jgi:hypothetical protein
MLLIEKHYPTNFQDFVKLPGASRKSESVRVRISR